MMLMTAFLSLLIRMHLRFNTVGYAVIMMNNNNNELHKRNQRFLVHQNDNGIARINVRFEGEDVWLPVELIMELTL